MKKLLVVLLAMVMVFAFATAAYAFTDTDNLSTVQQDSIYRLSALGVLNGYPDGTFGPANNITRAEFAKIACIVAGFGDVSSIMANTPSAFSDVAVGMWYTGYVNVAASQGYINGYPDGTFKPNKTISMAEVVTILLRIAGYDDNLPGPWPFDYIAKAGKLDVTDDVTFVSNVAASRADVAVMTNNLLDVDLVNWNSDTSSFEVDEDLGTVLEDSFEAYTLDVMFNNSCSDEDAIDTWSVEDYDDDTFTLYFSAYDDENETYDTEVDPYAMNQNCYFAGGNNLTTIGGQQADIILNDDDEVIYVKIVSTVGYSDDVDGNVGATLEVDGDEVDSVADFTYWYHSCFEYTESGYAKIFYNEDGDVYAVSDLYDASEFVGNPVIADSWDADDETLNILAGPEDVDLEDEDFIVLKDGLEIKPADIKSGDLVYVLDDNYDGDIVLMVGAYAEGKLTEGDDETVTVDDVVYEYGNYDWPAHYTTEGVEGDYNELENINDLDDVFDNEVQIAPFLNPLALAILVSDVNASSSTVYGIVTDITVGGLFDNVNDVTILNQEGEEVTYDLDDDDIFYYEEDGADPDGGAGNGEIELGCYVEVELDEDGVITGCNDIILAIETGYAEMDISSKKIKIGGSWYKITDDTLFFEAVYDDDPWVSLNFDEANLIDVADILSADSVAANIALVSNDGGTLERLYLVDSDIDSGNEGYSFVDRLYTNSSGDFVEMLDGTVAERDDSYDYYYDVFYAYRIVGGELQVTPLVFEDDDDDPLVPDTFENSEAETYGEPFDDGFWITDTGDLAISGEVYELDDLDIDVTSVDGDTVTLITGDYYTITDDTVFYSLDSNWSVDTADAGDLEDDSWIIAVSDDDANLLYVIIMPSMDE